MDPASDRDSGVDVFRDPKVDLNNVNHPMRNDHDDRSSQRIPRKRKMSARHSMSSPRIKHAEQPHRSEPVDTNAIHSRRGETPGLGNLPPSSLGERHYSMDRPFVDPAVTGKIVSQPANEKDQHKASRGGRTPRTKHKKHDENRFSQEATRGGSARSCGGCREEEVMQVRPR